METDSIDIIAQLFALQDKAYAGFVTAKIDEQKTEATKQKIVELVKKRGSRYTILGTF